MPDADRAIRDCEISEPGNVPQDRGRCAHPSMVRARAGKTCCRAGWRSQSNPPVFYIYSAPDAGKVKRIRNNPKVRIAPCTMRGDLRGAWVEAQARICAGDEAAHGQELLRRKYGWLKITGDFFSRLRGRQQVVIAVEMI